MEKLSISLIQTDLIWEQRQANREKLGDIIRTLYSDLIILPEAFTTGASIDAIGNAETMNGASLQWLADIADRQQCAITGSLIIREGDNFYNRLVFMYPDGHYDYYDKRHLFRMAGEHERYSAGNKRLIVNYKGWRICPMVCYDLRFPNWCRSREDYDLLLFVANWPQARRQHWRQLLIARAIENQAYVAGVNRIGVDYKNNHYAGDSLLIDPYGELIIDGRSDNTALSGEIEMQLLLNYRKEFPVHLDADTFTLGE